MQTVANLAGIIKESKRQVQQIEDMHRNIERLLCKRLGANNMDHARCLLRIAELEAELRLRDL